MIRLRMIAVFLALGSLLWLVRPSSADPLPPCVDGQYGPNAAGATCQVQGNTTPTALCQDSSFDYSRAITACAGHGGVLQWLGPGYTGQGPAFGPSATPSSAPSTGTSSGSGAAPTGSNVPPSDNTPAPSGGGSGSSAGPGVSFASISGAPPGGVASASIHAPSGATCTLSYRTPDDIDSLAQGLQGSRVAPNDGLITWTWTISRGSALGTGRLTAACTPGGSATAPIKISAG